MTRVKQGASTIQCEFSEFLGGSGKFACSQIWRNKYPSVI